jgi:hypothetical protein
MACSDFFQPYIDWLIAGENHEVQFVAAGSSKSVDGTTELANYITGFLRLGPQNRLIGSGLSYFSDRVAAGGQPFDKNNVDRNSLILSTPNGPLVINNYDTGNFLAQFSVIECRGTDFLVLSSDFDKTVLAMSLQNTFSRKVNTGTTLHVMAAFDPGISEHATHEDDTFLGANGWFPFEFVRDKVPNTIGIVEHACATNQNGDLHICGITDPGTLLHTIRFADGTWQSSWEGNFPPPDTRPITQVACATNQNGDLHVLAVTRSGTVYHTIRFADGTWQSSWEGNFPPPDIRPITQVACATNQNGDLHVLAVTQSGRVYHTIRFADGSFGPSWEDINAQMANVINILPIVQAACAFESTNNRLHLCVVNRTPSEQRLYYAYGEFPTGIWVPWDDVLQRLNELGNFLNVSISHTYVPK